jgi:two-component sensor histidine kinase
VSLGSNFIDLIEENLKRESFENLKKYFSLVFQGERQEFEGLLYNTDGKKIWTQTFLNPVYSEDNEVTEVACMSYEITEKKVIEEQMIETIREKEVLLQEVHHRVKNNLQVISSILNLQSSYVKDENSLKILRESQNRIKSMSFIHESLYHTGNFSQIEFSQYIYSLTTNLIHSYSYEKGNIKLETDFEKTFLSLDQAIPCGLIVNEIISNALKYAFDPEVGGEIFCSIVTKDNNIELRIGDNGVGMSSEIDYRNSDTLGLQLIYTLIEQLSATIDVDTESGTKYFITFEKQ